MTTLHDVVLDEDGIFMRAVRAGKTRTSADIVMAFSLTVARSEHSTAILVDHLYDDSDNLVLVIAEKGAEAPLVLPVIVT